VLTETPKIVGLGPIPKKTLVYESICVSHRPDGELYQIFRNQFLSYSMYISKISLIVLVTL